MKKGIISFGEALIDFHAQAAVDEDALPTFMPHPGGAPANVAVAVARLGEHACFTGMLGIDMFGDMLLADLDKAGVDTRTVRRTDAANTALAFVALDGEGERSFSFYRPPAADLTFRATDFDADALAAAAIFHAGSCSLTEAPIAETTWDGMRRARAAGAIVSFDMNLRPALWDRNDDPARRLWPALELAHLVKLSAEEMAFLAVDAGGEAAARDRLWQGGTEILLVTDGAAPLAWFTRSAHGSVPVYAVRAVDTTGAGDAFVGGLLYGLARADIRPDTLTALMADAERREAWLHFAAACVALAVTRTGSFAAMPERSAVDEFLEMHA
jgi:fructokinase